MSASLLSLSALEAFDPAARHGGELRFCCPLPACAGKAKSRAHRSLAVNARTGAWHCHRCGARGLLAEFYSRPDSRRNCPRSGWPARPPAPARMAPAAVYASAEEAADWRERLRGLLPFLPEDEQGKIDATRPSPAAAYLDGRGIWFCFAYACEARYSPAWCGGGPAVVFPLTDEQGELTALQGRYLEQRSEPRFRTVKRRAGAPHGGVFATLGALDPAPEPIVITEGPIDALSFFACGFAAAALCGKDGAPDWLLKRCRFRPTIIAFDDDPDPAIRARVDHSAAALAARLENAGARPLRLRPPGVKDWNDYLRRYGLDAMREALRKMFEK